MKIRLLNQKVVQFLPRGRVGMTLVEVVVALALAGLMVAGLVTGYIYCTTSAVKDSLYTAANAKAAQRLEETRSAIWAPYRATPVDELVTNNFPDETNVVLELSPSGSGNSTMATIKTTISQISDSPQPPVRRVRVDCIWEYKGTQIINTIETCRAPDQ